MFISSRSTVITDNITITDYEDNVILEQEDFKSIKEKHNSNQRYIEIKLTDTGQEKFANATKAIYKNDGHNYMNVYINEELFSSPRVEEEFNSDTIIITSSNWT